MHPDGRPDIARPSPYIVDFFRVFGQGLGALLLEVYLVQVYTGCVLSIISAELPVRLLVDVQVVGDE